MQITELPKVICCFFHNIEIGGTIKVMKLVSRTGIYFGILGVTVSRVLLNLIDLPDGIITVVNFFG